MLNIRYGVTVNASEIEARIQKSLPDAEVQVLDETGGGDHFHAVVVSASFRGKSLLERHQLVYSALQDAMRDQIHALRLNTYAPEEVE